MAYKNNCADRAGLTVAQSRPGRCLDHSVGGRDWKIKCAGVGMETTQMVLWKPFAYFKGMGGSGTAFVPLHFYQ